MKAFLGFLLLCSVLSVSLSDSSSEELQALIRPHIDPVYMKQKYKISEGEFFAVLDQTRDFILNQTKKVTGTGCSVCQGALNYFLSLNTSLIVNVARFIATEYCVYQGMEKRDVCHGAVWEMTPIIIESFLNHYLDPLRACPAIYLCPETYQEQDLKAYIKDVLKDKPDRPDPTPTGRETFKLVHVTDMHIDFDYTPDREADCGEPVCCEDFHGQAKSPASASGYWGTLKYDCDLPPYTLQQGLDFIAEQIDPDMVVWTGDTVDHTIWRQSQQKDIYATVWVTQEMKSRFNSSKTKVFPIDGNHECFPVNTFDYNSHREDPLKIAFSEAWKDWIGEKAADEVRKNVFYSSYYEKFNIKVIAIDTNTCPDGNYFLLENPTDPGNMLAWLRNELQDAENKGQIVYIIGHIPTSGCMTQWASRYEALTDRYSATIRGQFVGHTHTDLFQVLYTQDGSKPVGVQYIAPSLTTYADRRPAIRVIEVDVDTGIPVNFIQYRLNLTKYNAMGKVDKIVWDKTYDMKSEYNMSDLTPASMHALRNRIKDDPVVGAKIVKHNEEHEGETGNSTYFWCETISIDVRQQACHNGQSIEKQTLSLLERLGGPWIEKIKKDDLVVRAAF